MRHLKNRHALLVGPMFTCPITCAQNGCMRTFRYSYTLIRHIKITHDNGDVENGNGIPMVGNNGGDDDPIPHLNPMVPEQHVQQDLDEQDVRTSAATFVAKMKVSSSTVQSTVDNVVTEASRLFSDVIGKLKSKTIFCYKVKILGRTI